MFQFEARPYQVDYPELEDTLCLKRVPRTSRRSERESNSGRSRTGINRELIPRVIKNHELLAKHVESHEDGDSLARAQIERLEGRVAEIDSLTKAETERLEGRVAEIDSLTKAETERLEGRVAEIDSLTKAETERLEGRVNEIDSLD